MPSPIIIRDRKLLILKTYDSNLKEITHYKTEKPTLPQTIGLKEGK